jgi:hypothetical protein
MLIALLALGVMALTAAALVRVHDVLRSYSPMYYEPKDMERERYEMQRRMSEGRPGS